VSSAQADLAGVVVGGEHPVAVMGALNVSPESFYGGSVHRDSSALLDAGLAMVAEGASFVDVGARSTAPYLPTQISEEEESERLGVAVAALAGKLSVPISADTARARVARVALDAGAGIVNDVSGLRDPEMGPLVRERGVSVILMASPDGTRLGQPVASVRELLAEALVRARAASIPDAQVVLDPGIGFFRQAPIAWDEWDITVLAGLDALAVLGRPLAVGLSRKSFLGALTGRTEPAERLAGSVAATAVAVLHGAALIRTHDVAETLDAVRVAERIRRAARP